MPSENREGLGMKVIAVMVQRYGVLPREMWDLNSISDMGAGRGVRYNNDLPEGVYKSIISNNRYSIVNLTICHDVAHPVQLPHSLRRLNIMASKYDYPLDLPLSLQELAFYEYCNYNQPLIPLPHTLRKVKLNRCYDHPLTLPPQLIELEFGSDFQRPLVLPSRLKRLVFSSNSRFNLALDLPPSVSSLYFGDSYNQPTVLPITLEELRVGRGFTHELSLPSSLRKIEWCCNRPIRIPEGVCELYLGSAFTLPVTLPSSLKNVTIAASIYSHPITFPTCVEEITWCPKGYAGLVLPDSLQKLTWWSNDTAVLLPVGLKELVVGGDGPLALPEGLLRITFYNLTRCHWNLPASVQEMTLSVNPYEEFFSHPTTLQHLILEYSGSGDSEIDLSLHRIHKLTIENEYIVIRGWPQDLEELAFDVNEVHCAMRVPRGCRIVGEKRPANVIMME